MQTPLLNKLRSLNHDRYHIPGHKGITPNEFQDAFAIDFTEIADTGNLYEGNDIITQSEHLHNEYFGSTECMYITGGSTQGIMTAVFEAKPKKMLCDRNSHKALCHALAFVDCDYDFVYPQINTEFDIPYEILASDIKEKLENDEAIDTVYVTSPNYYGVTSDIKEIANVCKEFSVKLIVDEAHGCHFPAIGVLNAMKQGADFAITSVHKTAESLGQGACLMSKEKTNMRKSASIFGTSSPSYLIMSSIEYALANIHKYQDFLPEVLNLRKNIHVNTKFSVLDNTDTCRLVVNTKKTNISGEELASILEEKYKIVAEMSDKYNVVFILTYNDKNLDKLYLSLKEISEKVSLQENKTSKFDYLKTEKKLTVRQAMFSEENHIKLSDATNEVAKEMICPYPPGVPIIYPGEIIFQNHIEYMQNMCYNCKEYINIVKNR